MLKVISSSLLSHRHKSLCVFRLQRVLVVVTERRMLDQSLNNHGGDELSFWRGQIKLSKHNKGFTEHSCVDRGLDSAECCVFSFRHRSQSYSSFGAWRRRLLLACSSPGSGLRPAGQSSWPQWLDQTHLSECKPAAGLCNKQTCI